MTGAVSQWLDQFKGKRIMVRFIDDSEDDSEGTLVDYDVDGIGRITYLIMRVEDKGHKRICILRGDQIWEITAWEVQ